MLTFGPPLPSCRPLQVWGKLNKTFTVGDAEPGALDYFDQYVKWSDPNQPPFLQVGARAHAVAG